MSINYDILDTLSISLQYSIEYIYATDGRRLRSIHKEQKYGKTISDTTDYVGNLILKNGKPQMYHFDGGYYSFDGDNKPECHYYVQDYQGNNRMVVNADKDSVEQITHYYPYGGIIGNLSSNQEAQKYKYSGKEFDRTYGLDLYDFHARLFNPALPVFDRPNPLAEKFTWLTPYNYCTGDPVNCVDPDGMKIKIITSPRRQQELENCFEKHITT